MIFNDTAGWVKLEGTRILERPERMKSDDRGFRLFGEESRFGAKLSEVSAITSVAWDDGSPKTMIDEHGKFKTVPNSQKRPEGHVSNNTITARADLLDAKIHVFSLNNEVPVMTFRHIESVRIVPIDQTDRRNRQSATDELLGCGSLWLDEDDECLRYDGFIDRSAFDDLFTRISISPHKISEAVVDFSAGLYQDEVEGFFWKPGYTKDLGFLRPPGAAPTRINALSIKFGAVEDNPPVAHRQDRKQRRRWLF